MATTKTRKSDAKKQLSDYYLYVPLGAGQLLVEKTKTVSAKAFKLAKGGRKSAVRTYEDLAKRGENLAKSIRTSSPRVAPKDSCAPACSTEGSAWPSRSGTGRPARRDPC